MAEPVANVLRLGHVEYRVTDLERSRDFYVNLLGLHETERVGDRIYLRCIEDREHHTLILRRASSGGAGPISFRVATPDDLERLERRFTELDLPTKWLQRGEKAGQGPSLRVRDPFGFTVEFYAEMAEVEWLLQKNHLHRGAAPIRVDHVNVLTPDAQKGFDWYTGELGFKCAEYTESEPPEQRVWASWLYRKPTVHDIAVMTGPGPAVHHTGLALSETMGVIRACDALAGAGYADAIERGPARHGISNAFFVYLRDPDGNRVELYTGDYLTSDPNFKPIRWRLNDKRRQTLWGPPPPRRWFEEYMNVEAFEGDAIAPVQQPLLQAVPDYID
jgi:catechol 2,3-dioxygenase